MKNLKTVLSLFILMTFVSCLSTKIVDNKEIKKETQVGLKSEYEPTDSLTLVEVQLELENLMNQPQSRIAAPEVISSNPLKHIFMVAMENKEYNEVIGKSTAPYTNWLANNGANFTNYIALQHPSQPNYIGLFAGTRCGVSDNNEVPAKSLTQSNLYTTLLSKGKKFESYAQGLPSIGSTIWSTGRYRGRHDAPRNFKNVDQNCRKPLSLLPSNLNECGDLVWIIPDNDHNTHDQSVAYGDNWLKTDPQIQSIIKYCEKPENNSMFILWYDEGSTSINKTILIFYGSPVKKGVNISTSYGHYNLNRMFCSMYGVAGLNSAANSPAITGWEAEVIIPPVDTTKFCPKVISYDSTYTITPPSRDTVVHLTKTVYVPCDSLPVDTSSQGNLQLRILYIDHFNQRLGNVVEEEKMINYTLQTGHNGWALYDLQASTVLGNKTGEANLRNLLSRARSKGIIWIEAVSSGSISETNARVNYNKSCTNESQKFNGINEEWEPWWASDLTAAMIEDVNRLTYQRDQTKTVNMTSVEYWGWLTKGNFLTPAYTVKLMTLTDWLPLHYYQKTVSVNYHKTETDSLNQVCKRLNTTGEIAPIFSAEIDFSQNTLKTKTVEQLYADWKVGFLAKNYSNLKSNKFYTFTMSQLEYAIPYKSSTGPTARGISYLRFENKTSDKNLKFITEE